MLQLSLGTMLLSSQPSSGSRVPFGQEAGCGTTFVTAVSVLLAVMISMLLDVTVAELVIMPVVFGAVTVIVNDAVPPLASVPTAQVTTPPL